VGLAPLVSVGALNPNRTSVALFSNTAPWVDLYARGSSVVSTFPPFNGGAQSVTRRDAYDRQRDCIDPDDFTGGFAVWSGTSFAAPLVAGAIAALLDTLAGDMGWPSTAIERSDRAETAFAKLQSAERPL
jgi:subtilisin family serine protease